MKKSVFLVASLFALGALMGCENRDKTASVTLSSIAVSGQTTTFNVGDSFVFGGTVTATYSDNTTKDVTNDTQFAGYDMNTASTQTVIASYTEKKVTKTTSYSITVENRSDPPGPQEPVFAAYVDGVAVSGFAKTDADPNMLYQYKAVLDVTAGQTFTFTMNRSAISVSASTGENNLVDSVTGLSVHNNASQASLYFKVYGVYNPEELDTLHFEAWLSGYESTPGPETVPYKAFNESTEIELQATEKDEYMLAQYVSKNPINVKEFNLFTFTLDGQKLDVHANGDNNNLYYNEDQELKVRNDAEGVSLYLKVYDDEQNPGTNYYDAWLGGYQDPIAKDPKAYLHICLDTSIQGAEWRDVELSLKNGSETEYVSEELALTTSAEFVFKYVDTLGVDHWYNYDDVKAECIDLVQRSPEVPHGDGTTYSDNNIVVKADGDYTLFIDSAQEADDRIWIAKKSGEEEEPVYQAFNESTEIELETCDLGDDMVAQLKSKEKLSVKENNLFTFKKDGVAIDVHATEVKDNNLVRNNDGELKVHNDAEEVELYFKVYNDQNKPGELWFEAWLGGYEEKPVVDPVYTLKVGDGEAITMVDVTDQKKESDIWVKQFKAEGVELIANKTLTFFIDNVQIKPGAGDNDKNNVLYNAETGLLVIRVTATGNVYLKLYEDGGYDVWAEGYKVPGQEPIEAPLTVYLTDNESWGEDIRIHYWGEGIENTTWPGVAMTLVGQNDLGQNVYSFTLPKGTVGFIFNKNGRVKTVDLFASQYDEDHDGFYLAKQDDSGKWEVGTWNYQAPEA